MRIGNLAHRLGFGGDGSIYTKAKRDPQKAQPQEFSER